MTEKASEPKDWSLASREKRPSPLGSTLFVGLRAADAVLQYHLLRQGWAHDAISALNGSTVPTAAAGPSGLTPYGSIISALAVGASLKQGIWQTFVSEQEMKPAAAVAIAAFNTLFNTANTLLSAWAWSSVAPTHLPPSASVADTVLAAPALAVGVALFGVGVAAELGAEIQRMRFKARPRNKGKPYGGGLWAWATNVNYGGYTLWRAGYAMAAAGPVWGVLIGGVFFWDFKTRAVPVLDRYCEEKYGEDWVKIRQQTPYRILPFLY
ncbi:MAG: hypothetical protein LQ344_000806 [Seirophora lacunosa]|nr:MAG: hypothetical protein LQ344_000806 [Seirophora lacunosa]